MKIAVFILIIVFVLLALTVLRYRKEINAVIRFARMIRDGGQSVREIQPSGRRDPMAAEPLIKCATCGMWVPENRSRRLRTGDFYCSTVCLESRVTSS
jgi:hypothetical protein